MKIMPIYTNQQLSINNQKRYQKPSINSINQLINQDDFTCLTKNLQKQKFDLSFGAIPEKQIYKLCDDLLEITKNTPNFNRISIVFDFYNTNFKPILYKPLGFNSFDGEERIIKTFRHGLDNMIQGKERELKTKENGIQELVHEIKKFTKLYKDIEEWDIKNEIIPFQKVFEKLTQTSQSMKSQEISWIGKELLDDKKVQNPTQLYTLFEQPLLNAVKYSEEKPFEIVIEESLKNGKKIYYAKFINPETRPIPDDEIDKIIKGTGHRAAGTKEISGSGFGFQEIIRILKENGFEDDISNLIQKGREKGVCVRIPLIGIQ